MLSKVSECYFIVIASSPAKFKPCAIILCGCGDDPLERNTTGERPGCIYLPVFHLSSDTVSFLSRAVGIYWAASFRDPVEYNIKLQGGEKTCSALK